MSRICLIVNPAAGRGSARKRLPHVIKSFALAGITAVRESRAPGDEERVTLAALDAGCTAIAVVGGDGTCARVANAMLRAGAACALAVVPCGTGNDFAKTLGVLDFGPDRIAALCAQGSSRLIDVGFANGHYFLNSCGFGFDASVLEATKNVRLLEGDAVYIYSALRQLFTYRGIDVSINGELGAAGSRMLMVTVSNGRSLGGAFKIAPNGSVLDGELDVAYFRDSNILERIRLFAGAFRGTHLGMRSVTWERTRELSLDFATPPAMGIDGELRRATSSTVTLECIPRALAVVAAPGALS